MPHRALYVILIASAAAVSPRAARAEDQPVASAVTVVSDDPCLSGEALVASVRTWLRRETIDERVRVLVETASGAGSVTVLADGRPAAARRFERLPDGCPDRRAVLGLAVAIAIDAALVDHLAPPVPIAPEPAPASPSAARAPDADTAVAATSPRPARITLVLGADGAVALGLFAEPVGRVSIVAGVSVSDALSISLAADLSSPVLRPLGSGALEAMIAASRAQACVARGDATLELGGCIALSVGALLARGRGYARSFDVSLPWLAAGARVEATWWLDPSFGLALGVEALVPFPQQHLDVTDAAGQVVATEALPPAAVVISGGARFRVEP